MTVVAIHQPQYLPWVPYFDKADQADVFVYLDNVDYSTGGVQNRNQVKTAQGAQWLTVPVTRGADRTIKQVLIADSAWQRRHIRSIEQSYARAPHLDLFRDGLKPLLDRPWSHLADLNIAVCEWMFGMLETRCRRLRASELDVSGVKEELVIAICKAVGAAVYLSGIGAAQYQTPERFQAQGLELRYHSYALREYPQCWPAAGYLPDLSALDLLLNTGPQARQIMLGGRG